MAKGRDSYPFQLAHRGLTWKLNYVGEKKLAQVGNRLRQLQFGEGNLEHSTSTPQ